ncbi:MAG: HD domain-containing protein [Candidatus Heimdallarchaeota archaeon]|nr:MAG: HD domain-containing protein [Candidatus Heimdallarchaeota archaeon]
MVEIYAPRLRTIVNEIKEYYLQEETDFEGFRLTNSFLWDHCYRVACLAVWLARHPLALPEHKSIPEDTIFVSGLLHDAGKFQVKLDETSVREEVYSSKVTRSILTQHHWDKTTISLICLAIEELYQENSSPLAQLIHDADVLSKLGPQGLMSFISKWTLRALPPSDILRKKLSMELTYALNASKVMLTPQGQEEAFEESNWTIDYFTRVLKQWEEFSILKLVIRTVKLDEFQIMHVVSPRDSCGHLEWHWAYNLVSGVKCTKIQISGTCKECKKEKSDEFCIPV